MDRFFKKIAAKGYLLLSFMAFGYIAYRGSLSLIFASIVMVGSFVEFCIIQDDLDNTQEGNEDDF